MIRKLDKQEKELCRTGINNRKKRIAKLTNEIKYFTEFNQFNEKWKGYLEEQAKENKRKKEVIIQETIKQLIEQKEFEEKSMKTEQSQLKNGVEVKAIIGVN